MRTALLASLLFVVASPTLADEPLTLFGLPFNAPMSVPECNWRMTRDYMSRERNAMKRDYINASWSDNGGTCFTQAANNIGEPVPDGGQVGILFPLSKQPSMGRITARLSAGKIIRMEIRTQGINTQTLDFQALTDKFGKPTTLNRPQVQNRMGASFETIEAEWKLPDQVTVSYGSTLNRIDQGIVIISNPDGDAAEKKAQEEFEKRFGGTKL